MVWLCTVARTGFSMRLGSPQPRSQALLWRIGVLKGGRGVPVGRKGRREKGELGLDNQLVFLLRLAKSGKGRIRDKGAAAAVLFYYNSLSICF